MAKEKVDNEIQIAYQQKIVELALQTLSISVPLNVDPKLVLEDTYSVIESTLLKREDETK